MKFHVMTVNIVAQHLATTKHHGARPRWRGPVAALAALLMAGALDGCGGKAPAPLAPEHFASAEQVEMNFRGRSFVLGDNNTVAMVQPAEGLSARVFKLPFWLGINILVPGVLQPSPGDYYVISEADLVRHLDDQDEWMIEAGSSLIKKEAVLVTTRTRFRSAGKILPMIVQYMGTRTFRKGDGTSVEIPVLREVSLPMKWTFSGPIPRSYARFEAR